MEYLLTCPQFRILIAMYHYRLAPLFLLFLVFPAATEPPLGDVAFRQSLKDLGNDLRLMCVAAHPDDEDGATLAYYRKKYGVTTFAVIATRGEGGQNEIGPELYEELGVIRTREMMAAAEIEGAQLRFLNLPEFGFSKSREETLAVWGHDVALERMVRLIRKEQPNVIITNHGRLIDHGHHQAIGAVVFEAFDATADPAVFPEHLDEGLRPWQVARVYSRSWGETLDGQTPEPWHRGPNAVPVPIHELNEERGRTYAEIAAAALGTHESQGMQVFIDRYLTGEPVVYYDLIREAPVPAGFEGMVMDEACGPLFAGVPHATNADLRALSEANDTRTALKPALLKQAATARPMRKNSDATRRIWQRTNRAAAVAADLRLEASVNDTLLVPGQAATITAKFRDFGARDADSVRARLRFRRAFQTNGDTNAVLTLNEHGAGTGQFAFVVPPGSAPTLPYAAHVFENSFLQPQIYVEADVQCGGTTLTLEAPVYVDIAPPVGVNFVDAPYLVQAGSTAPLTVGVLLSNNADGPQEATLSLSGPTGWPVQAPAQLQFAAEDEQQLVQARIQPPADAAPGDYTVQAWIPGLPSPVETTLRVVDVVLPETGRVGVIQSYDDTYMTTLARLGIDHEDITLEDFSPARLDQFDTIIIDIRAYQYRADLVANNGALLDYVQRGGTLLVNYMKTFEWQREFAPYPITLSRNRVTREDAPMEVLVPDHPFFNHPNTLQDADWDGWRQERGLYFPVKWDDAYTPLIATADPGEVIPPGSCLVAEYGEGTYFYTALGWYRQLRELHPGALRAFANMLAL